MTQAKQFKAGIIGAGIGAAHIEGYLTLPEQFTVATVCDLDEERATKAAAGVPDAQISTDMAEVLADPQIDIINVCLPPHLHYPVMMRALEAGKHVVCEKPFTTSLAEADKVMELSKRVGKQVFPVFQYRYGLGFQRLMRLVGKGMVGQAFAGSMETHWKRGADYYAVPWRGTWAGERGGTIVGHAIHIHNLATHLLGPVQKVSAFLDTKVNPIETEDCAAISMVMENGALMTSSINLGSATDMSRMRVCYEHVTAESGLQPYTIGAGDWTFTATNPERQAEFDAVTNEITEVPTRFNGLFDRVHKILTGAPKSGPTMLEEARHSVELITAIYHSHRKGKVVSLPLDATHPMYGGWVLGE